MNPDGIRKMPKLIIIETINPQNKPAELRRRLAKSGRKFCIAKNLKP
ncbi:MAG: hypothetical protein ACRCUY_00125 [Thermoguttaceae bacterium]